MGGLEGNRALITNYARFYSTGNTRLPVVPARFPKVRIALSVNP